MDILNDVNNLANYTLLNEEELSLVLGGFAITLAGVTLVLTVKGLAAAAGIIGGAYSVGYVIGKGWAYIK